MEGDSVHGPLKETSMMLDGGQLRGAAAGYSSTSRTKSRSMADLTGIVSQTGPHRLNSRSWHRYPNNVGVQNWHRNGQKRLPDALEFTGT